MKLTKSVDSNYQKFNTSKFYPEHISEALSMTVLAILFHHKIVTLDNLSWEKKNTIYCYLFGTGHVLPSIASGLVWTTDPHNDSNPALSNAEESFALAH